MDILCPVCGEPWDNDSLHEVVSEGTFADYKTAAREFRTRGCGVVFGNSACKKDAVATERHGLKSTDAAAALYDLLGDDMDGAAAMLEDYGF